MAPTVTRFPTLVALFLVSAALASSSASSASAPAFDLAALDSEGLFEYTSSAAFLDDSDLALPAPEPEPADWELLPADEQSGLFARTVDGNLAKSWHAHSLHGKRTSGGASLAHSGLGKRALGKAWSGKSKFASAGSTGVAAMQVRPALPLLPHEHALKCECRSC